ncbi:MAG: PhoH family protein [Candidatus Latescibacteria bacterium]|nr:PhoH family protein [Candidatus Latescibacterota bacterium]
MSCRVSLNGVDPLSLYGHNDVNLIAIGEKYDVRIVARGDEILIEGSPAMVQAASDLLEQMVTMLDQTGDSDPDAYSDVIRNHSNTVQPALRPDIILSTEKKIIRPRSQGQALYIAAIANYDVVFGIGPAGTGKTYLAVAMAIAALRAKEVSRIILTRPAVEAGERLGFLPGDLLEKIDPYLRPLYDALHDMIAPERLRRLTEMRTIEIVPLAYMRGRTLNNAFIILDEAQNATATQMKMFLTRLGLGSKAIITGDITQIDLPADQTSGLIQSIEVMAGIEGITFVYLTEKDVVRHPLVQKIIVAYETYLQRQQG